MRGYLNGVLTGSLLLGLSLVSGCGNRGEGGSTNSPVGTAPSGGNSGGNNRLSIISPHGREIQGEFERAFKAKNPDAQIKFLDQGGTTDDLNFVRDQFKSKSGDQGINIDLFFGGGAETFLELDELGALQSLPSDYGIPAKLNGVPLRAEQNRWVGAALSGFGILYNKSLMTRDNLPIPQTWADMGNPKLRGKVELADPRHSGSAHTAYEIILQTNGWEKGWQILTGMACNASAFIDSSSRLLQDVQGGQAVAVPAIDFYARAAIGTAGADKLGYVEPKGQSVVTPDPIALLKGAPNPELARKFVAFVMSPEGQKLWVMEKGKPGGPTENTLFRQPALPSLYKPIPAGAIVKSDPYATKNARPYDSEKAALRRQPLDDLIGAVLIDNHDLLKKKWAANPNLAKLSFLPVSEAQLAALAPKWKDSVFKNKTTSVWSQAAKAHFNQQ